MSGFWNGSLIAALSGALAWGLLGGFSHCIGMCGIFVISAGKIDEPAFFRRIVSQLGFQTGRLVSLTLIGTAAGEIGSLAGLASHFAKAQGMIALIIGVLTVLFALGYAGILPKFRIPEPDLMGTGGGAGRKLFIAALKSRSSFQPILLGALVGLLPCGLTYTIAIWAASTQSAAGGALVLLTFGLGTIPGLLALGLLGHLFRGVLQKPEFRVAMTRSGAIVMLVMGAVLIWRGWQYL